MKSKFVFLLLAIDLTASATEIRVAATPPGKEVFLEVKNYRLDCGGRDSRGLPGLAGSIEFENEPGPVIRFDLFQGKDSLLVPMGISTHDRFAQIQVRPFQNTVCRESDLKFEIIYKDVVEAKLGDIENRIPELARSYSPFLVVRGDQYWNRETDLPLEMVYDVSHQGDRLTIRYTLFFSDEDSKTSGLELEEQMARYGRSTDIEWIYAVTFRKSDGKILEEDYQGGIFDKLNAKNKTGDHATLSVKAASFFPGTRHRIFYNQAKNNIFSEKPTYWEQKVQYVAYHLSPQVEIQHPRARESFQLEQASYMYLVSEKEAIREQKQLSSPEDFLFAEMIGRLIPTQKPIPFLFNGAFSMQLNWQDPSSSTPQITESAIRIDRLGEDMHWVASSPALKVGRKSLGFFDDGKAHGQISFSDKRFVFKSSEFQVTNLVLSRLVWDESLRRYERKLLPNSYFQKGQGFGTQILINELQSPLH